MLNISMQTPEVKKLSPKITVVGVGGAGGNAVNNMISSGLEGCEFLVCNTDAQALEGSLCDSQLQLGAHVTGGLGAGAKPEIGEKAAHESLDEVMQYLEGSNMAFITAGMGGGTGTGAAPVIAKACRDSGILTVGVVTKPFHFEGTHRMRQAEAGIEEMQGYVDTLIVIPNQNLFRVANEKTTFAEAFKMADGVLQSGVRGVTDLMVMPGLINLDFADIRSAMLEMGKAMMGNGEGEGDRRAIEAAEAAINNPLLDDVSMQGARGVIINVTGGADMTLFEVDEACNRIRDEVDQNANIIFGSTFDEKLEGTMRVSVVATGIDAAESSKTISGGGNGGITVPATPKTVTPTSTETPKVAKTATATTASEAVQRPIPQTEVARAMTLNARQQTTATTTPVKAQPAATAQPKIDMFEQQEFHAVAPATTQTAPQTQTAASQKSSDMRGQVHRGSFIPPSPVVPEKQEDIVYNPAAALQGYVPTQMPVAAAPILQQQIAEPAPVEVAQETSSVQPTQGLVLRPPVSGTHTPVAEKRKSPSLLERITGVYGNVMNGSEAEDGEATQSDESSSSGGFHSGLRAEKTADKPSQGKLNIDSPAAAPSASEEDLDIPAFLRRQAN